MRIAGDRKTFWVISLTVITLSAAAVAASERYVRRGIEQVLTHAMQEQARLGVALAGEQRRAHELDTRLSQKSREADQLIARVTEESRAVAALREDLTRKDQLIGKLQTELVLASRAIETETTTRPTESASGSIELAKIPVKVGAAGGVKGKVIQIHPDWSFVVMDLGWNTVGIGDVLGVYHNQQLVAEVQVERVQDQVAAARVLPAYQIAQIAVNDEVAAR